MAACYVTLKDDITIIKEGKTYIGVEIDDTLTWHSQIDQIVKKVSADQAIMKRAWGPFLESPGNFSGP